MNNNKKILEENLQDVAFFSIVDKAYCVNVPRSYYPSNFEDIALAIFEIISQYTDDYGTILNDIKQTQNNMDELYNFQVEDDDTITFYVEDALISPECKDWVFDLYKVNKKYEVRINDDFELKYTYLVSLLALFMICSEHRMVAYSLARDIYTEDGDSCIKNGVSFGGWYWFRSNDNLNSIYDEKAGKWMYFFKDQNHAIEICNKAISENICSECKCSDLKKRNSKTGTLCFYINADDIEAHKRVIKFMIENNLIQKTKKGNYSNISFKLNEQTENGEYGKNFEGKIKLNDFIDLKTGNWKK